MAATVGASDPSSGPDSSPESPYSSPDSSPTIRRPFTTVGWEHPYTSVSPRTRPSTTIGWESRVLEKATLERGGRRCSLGHGAGRRHSTGTRRALETSPDWCPMEVEAGGSGEDSEETDWGSPQQCNKVSLLDLVQSKKNRKEKFRRLLLRLMHETSSGINCTEEDNMTPLHFAVLSGDKLCVEALVAFGANVNAKNSFNQTPLDVAAENQQEHLIPLLVSIGCRRGRDIPETCPQHPTRKRAVSSPHEPPCGAKLHSPDAASRSSKNSQRFKFDDAACPSSSSSSSSIETKMNSALSRQLERHIHKRFEATQSVNPDEAFALALQQQEIVKFKSRCPPLSTRPPKTTPTPHPDPMIRHLHGNRILSLDGGGVRALIQIDILCELERLTGKKITELFDWIIGTSSGGIVALALVYRQMPLYQLRNLYFRLKDEVFSKGRTGFCYDSAKLEELLKESLGTDMRMGDVSHPKVLVGAVDKSQLPLKLNFFNNCFDDEFSKQYIWKVARYTSAAPMYFTESDNYVDGGVMANNPCIGGLNKIQSFYKERGIHLPIACMVSLGSGISPSQELGSVDIFLRLRFAGMFRRAQDLISMLSSAIGESEALADQCRTTCEVQKIPFFRFNPQLGEKVDTGMTDNRKLLQMIITTRIYTHTQEAQLEKLLKLLHKNPGAR